MRFLIARLHEQSKTFCPLNFVEGISWVSRVSYRYHAGIRLVSGILLTHLLEHNNKITKSLQNVPVLKVRAIKNETHRPRRRLRGRIRRTQSRFPDGWYLRRREASRRAPCGADARRRRLGRRDLRRHPRGRWGGLGKRYICVGISIKWRKLELTIF